MVLPFSILLVLYPYSIASKKHFASLLFADLRVALPLIHIVHFCRCFDVICFVFFATMFFLSVIALLLLALFLRYIFFFFYFFGTVLFRFQCTYSEAPSIIIYKQNLFRNRHIHTNSGILFQMLFSKFTFLFPRLIIYCVQHILVFVFIFFFVFYFVFLNFVSVLFHSFFFLFFCVFLSLLS